MPSHSYTVKHPFPDQLQYKQTVLSNYKITCGLSGDNGTAVVCVLWLIIPEQKLFLAVAAVPHLVGVV